jgi:hypothetical protein
MALFLIKAKNGKWIAKLCVVYPYLQQPLFKGTTIN